jgi:hypothetical protein
VKDTEMSVALGTPRYCARGLCRRCGVFLRNTKGGADPGCASQLLLPSSKREGGLELG